MLAATIALASSFMTEPHGAPAMLFALLTGMAFRSLAEHPKSQTGIACQSRTQLRIGVAQQFSPLKMTHRRYRCRYRCCRPNQSENSAATSASASTR